MEIDAIRASIQKGSFFVTDHALTEGFKDGISVADMLHVVQTGKIIEQYPGRKRCLVYGHNSAAIPVHVVIDCSAGRSVDIVTTYVPQRDEWIKSQVRKKTKAVGKKACPECSTVMRQGRTTLHFERGGFYADVENVNAMLCGRCGARSVPGRTALKISDAVERLFRAGKDLDMTGISFHKLAS
jgi:YgiT-type zinc finger domain-containing protein